MNCNLLGSNIFLFKYLKSTEKLIHPVSLKFSHLNFSISERLYPISFQALFIIFNLGNYIQFYTREQ